LEKRSFPRGKACEEFLSATSLPLLRYLGMAAHERVCHLVLKAELYTSTKELGQVSNIARTADDSFPEHDRYLSIPVRGRPASMGAGPMANETEGFNLADRSVTGEYSGSQEYFGDSI
jgi:hypothetical protein